MLLQPKLNVRVSQRQVLTPGLVQMVSVLALNKLELKEMINSEMIENPVLEELEESNASMDERAGLEGDRERSVEAVAEEAKREEKDPFDEIDFGSYFQDYLDPGFKTASNFEEFDKPSFEHFLVATKHAERSPAVATGIVDAEPRGEVGGGADCRQPGRERLSDDERRRACRGAGCAAESECAAGADSF